MIDRPIDWLIDLTDLTIPPTLIERRRPARLHRGFRLLSCRISKEASWIPEEVLIQKTNLSTDPSSQQKLFSFQALFLSATFSGNCVSIICLIVFYFLHLLSYCGPLLRRCRVLQNVLKGSIVSNGVPEWTEQMVRSEDLVFPQRGATVVSAQNSGRYQSLSGREQGAAEAA